MGKEPALMSSEPLKSMDGFLIWTNRNVTTSVFFQQTTLSYLDQRFYFKYDCLIDKLPFQTSGDVNSLVL